MPTMTPPKPFKRLAPYRITVQEGGGCLALFGLPFLAAGICTVLAAGGVIPVQTEDPHAPSWSILLLGAMGLVFALVGGGLVFGRHWIIIDTRRSVITKQWGLLVPLRGKEWHLQDFSRVVLRFESGDADSSDRYPVYLTASGNQQDLLLATATEYGEARQQAAFLATFLNYPLEDATTDYGVLLNSNEINMPWVARMRLKEVAVAEAPRPSSLYSQVTSGVNGVRIVIPGPGFRPVMLFGLLFPIGALTFVTPWMLDFFQDTHTPHFISIAFTGFALVLFVVIPLIHFIIAIMHAKRSRITLTVDGKAVTHEERRMWRTVTTTIPCEEILDIDYNTAQSSWQAMSSPLQHHAGHQAPMPVWLSRLKPLVKSKGISIKTNGTLITIGAGLPDDEVCYLYATIARSLIAR